MYHPKKILGRAVCPGPSVRREQFHATARQVCIQAVRLICVVANEPHRSLPDKPLRESRVDQGDFVWRGTLDVNRDRKSVAIGIHPHITPRNHSQRSAMTLA